MLIKNTDMEQPLNKALIFGAGPCAREITSRLLTRAAKVVLVTGHDDRDFNLTADFPTSISAGITIVANAALHSCRGAVGNFTVTLRQPEGRIEVRTETVIIAEEADRAPNFSLYGLRPSPKVVSLSALREAIDGQDISNHLSVVFLTGLKEESNPVILEETLTAARELQSKSQARIYLLTGNLKVAGDGLEALYRDTEQAGLVCVKFTGRQPLVNQDENDIVTIEFIDEITGQPFKISPDLTVVDEKIIPAENLADLSRILGLHRNMAGFPQAFNVHRLSVLTNRKGVFVAGGTKGLRSNADSILDAADCALECLIQTDFTSLDPEDKARIDPARCARCLTCLRVCPHAAISLNGRPEIIPAACEQCGLCAAACPGHAISLKGFSFDRNAELAFDRLAAGNGNQFVPSLAALCCQRSAVQAKEMADSLGLSLPSGLKLVEVSCGGSISPENILSAFETGADGVLVMTCHEGNCRSEHGGAHAKKRALLVNEWLKTIGYGTDRLVTATVASNTGHDFARIVNEFAKKITLLGPLNQAQETS